MQSLAHLHMLTGDLEACNQRCMLILKLDKDNDQATLVRILLWIACLSRPDDVSKILEYR